MSDYATVTVIVYQCDEEERTHLVEWMDEQGFEPEHDPAGFGVANYLHDEPLGRDGDILQALIEIAPSATLRVWQDPKYEYDGSIHIHVPALGTWTGQCNSDGQPYLTAYEARPMIEAEDWPGVKRALGIDHLDHIDVQRRNHEATNGDT